MYLQSLCLSLCFFLCHTVPLRCLSVPVAMPLLLILTMQRLGYGSCRAATERTRDCAASVCCGFVLFWLAYHVYEWVHTMYMSGSGVLSISGVPCLCLAKEGRDRRQCCASEATVLSSQPGCCGIPPIKSHTCTRHQSLSKQHTHHAHP